MGGEHLREGQRAQGRFDFICKGYGKPGGFCIFTLLFSYLKERSGYWDLWWRVSSGLRALTFLTGLYPLRASVCPSTKAGEGKGDPRSQE
jgi:hypothetical protein